MINSSKNMISLFQAQNNCEILKLNNVAHKSLDCSFDDTLKIGRTHANQQVNGILSKIKQQARQQEAISLIDQKKMINEAISQTTTGNYSQHQSRNSTKPQCSSTQQIKQSPPFSLQSPEKGAILDHTKSTSSNSITCSPNNNFVTSNNTFRKPIQEQRVLNIFDSMFKKKGSLLLTGNNQEFNGQIYVENCQRKENSKKVALQNDTREKMQIINRQGQLKQRLVQRTALVQRLKNIHLFYKMAINNQIEKRKQNDHIFMDMLQQNQIMHKKKIHQLQKALTIQRNPQAIITKRENVIAVIESMKSSPTKARQRQLRRNKQLKEKLEAKKTSVRQKECYLQSLQEEEKELRQKVDTNDREQLKIKNWKKEIERIIAKDQQKISKMREMYDKDEGQYANKLSF